MHISSVCITSLNAIDESDFHQNSIPPTRQATGCENLWLKMDYRVISSIVTTH